MCAYIYIYIHIYIYQTVVQWSDQTSAGPLWATSPVSVQKRFYCRRCHLPILHYFPICRIHPHDSECICSFLVPMNVGDESAFVGVWSSGSMVLLPSAWKILIIGGYHSREFNKGIDITNQFSCLMLSLPLFLRPHGIPKAGEKGVAARHHGKDNIHQQPWNIG